jgi:chromosome transmission fidelity protein 18
MKESESSFMDVITDIFSPLSKSRVKDLGLTSEEENKYVDRITRSIDTTGSLDKVALACFEHYPNYRIHDANFKAYEQAHEWLNTYDSFSHGMWQDREYAIMPYLAYSLTPFYPLFATKGAPKLERPKMDWEVSSRFQRILISRHSTPLFTPGFPKTTNVRRDIQNTGKECSWQW